MSGVSDFKKHLSSVMRLWDVGNYDRALEEVEALLEEWPGNDHLYILRASLIQLQEEPKNGLEEAREALQQAIELDKDSCVSRTKVSRSDSSGTRFA